MDRTTVHMSAKKQMSLQEINSKINKIQGIKQVSKTEQTINDVIIWTLVYEMFFMRAGGYASLTVVFTEHDGVQTACIVGSGGGRGVVNVSFGANRNCAELCEKALQECGFDFTYFE